MKQKQGIFDRCTSVYSGVFWQNRVVKYGGNAMINEDLKKKVIQDIILMKYVDETGCSTHTGGPDITFFEKSWQRKLNLLVVLLPIKKRLLLLRWF